MFDLILRRKELGLTGKQLSSRMKTLIKAFPSMVKLSARLIVDERVSKKEKALFASALIYAVTPLDFLPDFLPFIGQVDDAYLVALTLLRLVNRTDASIVREHWTGKGDIVEIADSIAAYAPAFLPKRTRAILTSNIDFAPLVKRGKLMMQGKGASVLVEEESGVDDKKKGLMRVVE